MLNSSFPWMALPMRLLRCSAVLLSALLAGPVLAHSLPEVTEATCTPTEPATLVPFDGHPWEIYRCQDGMMAFVAAGQNNPAAPAYYAVQPQADGVHIERHGSDQPAARAAQDRALVDLRAFLQKVLDDMDKDRAAPAR
jgi:hypothetical protein